jgi:predicted nucleic acid-binding protein
MTAKTASRRAAPPRGPLYLDASALVKLYLPEAESDALEALLLGRSDLLVSDLSVTEVVAAGSRRCREGHLKEPDLVRLHRALLDDLADASFIAVHLEPATHRAAERLLIQSSGRRLRAADALHLAMALSVGARTMLTYDQRLGEAAKATGLHVGPIRSR